MMLPLLALALLRVGLGYDIPPSFLDLSADDALFVAQADALLEGDWLGPYDHRRLLKGPGYALFLAAASASGLGRRLAEDIVHVLASLLLYGVMRRFGCGRISSALAYGVTLFHPVMFGMPMDRVFRDGLYASQSLLVLGLSSLLVLPATTPRRVLTALAAGLMLAWFWVTRGEGLWLLPALGLLLVGGLRTDKREGRSMPAALTRLALVALCLALPTLAAVYGWRTANERHYGHPVTHALKAPEFSAAMGALNRIAETNGLRYEPLTPEQREQLYELSPMVHELKPWLESDAFRITNHQAENGERTAVFRAFLIRDAAATLGHHESPKTAEDYYRRLAAEVNALCDRGAIDAGPPRPDLLPAITGQTLRQALTEGSRIAQKISRLQGPAIPQTRRIPERSVTPEVEARFARVIGRDFGQDFAGSLPRLAAVRSIRFCIALPLTLLSFAAAIALGFLFLRLAFVRHASPLKAVALAWTLAFGARWALVSILKASWFLHVDSYLITAYLLLAPTAFLLLAAAREQLMPRRLLSGRAEGVCLLLITLGALGLFAFLLRDPHSLEPALTLRHDEGSSRRLVLSGAQVVPESTGDQALRSPRLRLAATRADLLLLPPAGDLPRSAALRFEADFERLPYGRPFLLEYQHVDESGRRQLRQQLLASKGAGPQTWVLPLPPGRLSFAEVHLPRLGQNPFRILDLSVTTAGPLPDARPRPGAPLTATHDREHRCLTLDLREAEPNTTYRLYLAESADRDLASIPGLQGTARISPRTATRNPSGEPYVFDLITDEQGRATRVIPWPSNRPRVRVAQAHSPLSLSAPAEILILGP